DQLGRENYYMYKKFGVIPEMEYEMEEVKEIEQYIKEQDLEPWTSCEFDFTSEGKLKVSFDYIDWINTELDQLGRENYYMYKKFGVIPEMEYEMEEVKEIEQYIKEQDLEPW
ncbi:TIGR01741 family protein, partial [Staphylococcus aureus]|uniref:TIGR01741 family protein n=1 Tax=Staphylococcus aureus TaxID=1280 RepID=UPI00210D160A